MGEPSRTAPASTFVLRFWREWSATEGRWRGRIEHVQSGQGADFLELGSAWDFLESWGVMYVEQSPPGTEDEKEER